MLDHQLIAKGYFHAHHQSVRTGMDDVNLKNFTNLEDDLSRVAFMRNVAQIRNFDPKSIIGRQRTASGEKSAEKARLLKAEGNSAVQAGSWASALDLYTKSYVAMPSENVSELAIIIANRSAALYHLKQYESALLDIEMALAFGYPKDLKHKIYDRRARCYLALKWNNEAILAFRETVTSLDDANLPKDKCSKKQTDAQLMIEILERGIKMINSKRKDTEKEKIRTPSKKEIVLPPVKDGKHEMYPSASHCIQVQSNDTDGRFVTASKDVEVGDVVVVEKSYCSVLLSEFSKTNCQHCFERCIAPLACPMCANVVFCSEKCKNAAVNSYHKYECPILDTLWESGCSITCHMALRMISQKELAYFTDLRPKLGEEVEGKYLSGDYRRVYNLVGHEKLRSKSDFFQRTHMAVFLLNLLRDGGYFGLNADGDDELQSFVGSLVLRNLQVLQFNAHEIFELQCDRSNVKDGMLKRDQGKSVFLGGGLYPTLALFNHSCDPGVVRYFQGTSVVVRAVKSIKASEQIAENYGPIFTRKPCADRRAELKDQYWFDCHCLPCEQKWPTFEDMDDGLMRFKCDAGAQCKNVVLVPTNCEEFMIKCELCHEFTNILKGLKALQDTVLIQKIAKDHMEKGEYQKALLKFIEELKLYEETLAPPFRDYHLCQQNIRRCFLTLGNFSVK